jgi:hypothetical protein
MGYPPPFSEIAKCWEITEGERSEGWGFYLRLSFFLEFIAGKVTVSTAM